MEKKLLRSKDDRVIAGVCGGLGEYFGIDTVLFRIAAVLLLLVNGFGAIMYIIAWVAIPENNKRKKDDMKQEKKEEMVDKENGELSGGGSLLVALFAIILGVLLLINNFVDIFNFQKTWPLLLIFLGVVLLFKNSGEDK